MKSVCLGIYCRHHSLSQVFKCSRSRERVLRKLDERIQPIEIRRLPFNIRASSQRDDALRVCYKLMDCDVRVSRALHTVFIAAEQDFASNGVCVAQKQLPRRENFIIVLYAIDYRPREFDLAGLQRSVHLVFPTLHDVASYNFDDFV